MDTSCRCYDTLNHDRICHHNEGGRNLNHGTSAAGIDETVAAVTLMPKNSVETET